MNINKHLDREAIQTFQDAFAEQNNLAIVVLDPQLQPVTRPSYPESTLFQRSIRNQPLAKLLFRIERNMLAMSSYIDEPLFSSFLSGQIIRSILPISIHHSLVAYLCTLKITSEVLPYHMFAQVLASSRENSSVDAVLEQFMDTFPLVPSRQLSDQLDSLAREISVYFDQAYQTSLAVDSSGDPTDEAMPDSGSELLIFTSATGEIVHLTKPVVTLLGYSDREEMKGKNIFEFVTLAALESVSPGKEFSSLFESEIGAVALRHKDGAILYGDLHISSYRPGNRVSAPLMYQWQIEPLPSPPGQFREMAESRREKLFGPWQPDSTTFSSASIDGTETLAGKGHQETGPKWPLGSARALATILDTYPLPLLIINKEEELIHWNTRAEQLFGLTAEAETVKFAELLQEEFLEKWHTQKESIVKSDREARRPATCLAKCKTVSGDSFSANLRLYKTELDGSPLLTITVEETDQAVTGNEYLQGSQEADAPAILLTDGSGNILSANRQAWNLLSWNDEIIGTRLADIADRKYRHDLNNFFIKLYSKEKEQHKVKLAGMEQEYTLSAEKLSFGSKGEYYLLLRFENEQESPLQNQEWRNRKSESGSLFPLFSELLAQLSYRLFEGLATLQEELLADPEQESLLDKFESIAEQASNLGEKLGFIYNRKAPQFKPQNLNLLLEDLYKTIRTEFRNPINLELNKVPQIHADQEEVWFVVQALLQNADEATTKKHPIDITTYTKLAGEQEQCFRPEDWGKEFVCCKVSDRGKGIPPRIRNRLYSPFVTDKEEQFGRGFSLACVRAILDRCGGYIDYDTEIDRGTSFYVYFPALPKGAGSATCNPVLDPERNTVLAVDDEAAILDLYRTTLDEQYNVICAASGEEAIRIMREHKSWIDLCIVDVNLPDSGMINCPDELLKIKPDIPFIIATGEINNGSLDHFLSKARSFWLHKPFPPSTLKRAVQRLLKVY